MYYDLISIKKDIRKVKREFQLNYEKAISEIQSRYDKAELLLLDYESRKSFKEKAKELIKFEIAKVREQLNLVLTQKLICIQIWAIEYSTKETLRRINVKHSNMTDTEFKTKIAKILIDILQQIKDLKIKHLNSAEESAEQNVNSERKLRVESRIQHIKEGYEEKAKEESLEIHSQYSRVISHLVNDQNKEFLEEKIKEDEYKKVSTITRKFAFEGVKEIIKSEVYDICHVAVTSLEKIKDNNISDNLTARAMGILSIASQQVMDLFNYVCLEQADLLNSRCESLNAISLKK